MSMRCISTASLLALGVLAGCDNNNGELRSPVQPPTISNLADVTVDEDTVVGPLAITLTDSVPMGSNSLSAVSNNTVVCPATGISLGGNANARTITITPADDAVGTCGITLTAASSTGLFVTSTFNLTFREVRVSHTTFARDSYGQAAAGLPQDINRVKFDFPDDVTNNFQAYSDLLPQ